MVLGIFTLADMQNTPELNQGKLLRFLAEIVVRIQTLIHSESWLLPLPLRLLFPLNFSRVSCLFSTPQYPRIVSAKAEAGYDQKV
jgi:hypothetical protein